MEQTRYDFHKFSQEDFLLYREALGALPFDPELNAFFIEQAHRENRRRYRERRYAARVPLHASKTASPALSAEQEFFRQETRRELEEAMRYLPVPVRERIVLHLMYGVPYAEIARRERLTESAVLQSVQSGIRRLRAVIKIRKLKNLTRDP